MKKIIAYIALPALIFTACNKVLELDEVEAGFAERGALPEVSIDPSTIVVDEYAQTVTLDVTFGGVTADMDSLELGLLSGQDAGFTESSVTLLEEPANGTYRMTVHVAAGATNYVKAMAATTDGAVYSERITVDVPDIPWYYKIAAQYVGTYEPDSNTASQGATAYENHVVKVELSDDLSTITFYDIDPYVQEAAGTSYVSGRMNYITGELDLDARTVTFTVVGYGVNPNFEPYLLAPITSYSEEGYGVGQSFVITFSEDADEFTLPWYAVLDNEAGNLPFVYSEDGITLSAN